MNARIMMSKAIIPCILAGLASCTGKVTESQQVDPRVAKFAQLPDWRGVWIAEGANPGIDGFPEQGGKGPPGLPELAGLNAPWTDAVRGKLGANLVSAESRADKGWGYPMMMSSSAPFEIVVSPEQTLFINMYREVRHVFTDGRDHPAATDRWPTTWGDSVGRWEGDTLVIDTVSVRDPYQFFGLGPPLSENAHYTERLRLVSPGRIESEMTIEEKDTLTKPWVVKLAYVRDQSLDHLVHDDFTNDRSLFKDGMFTIVPPKK